MEMRGLPWETTYCPELTVFKSKKVRKFLAFASRLDNQIRQAKKHGAELLPDDKTTDRHFRLLFWLGLEGSVKDKTRHKKESCKTFAELIAAARYGEKQANSTQFPRRVARQNSISDTRLMETHELPEWLPQAFSVMAREVRETVQPLINN